MRLDGQQEYAEPDERGMGETAVADEEPCLIHLACLKLINYRRQNITDAEAEAVSLMKSGIGTGHASRKTGVSGERILELRRIHGMRGGNAGRQPGGGNG